MKRQRGQALAMVLIFLMLGTLTIIPILNYTVIGLKSQSTYSERLLEEDSSDAALLDAIWQILSNGILMQIDPETGQYVYDFELGLNKWGITVEIPSVGESEWQAIRVNMFSKIDVEPVFLDALGEKTFRYIFRLDMPSWDMSNYSFVLPEGLTFDTGSAVHFAPIAQNEVDPDAAVEAVNFIFNYNGSSWTSTSDGTTEYLCGIWGSSSSDIFAVGGSGTILHYNGSNWTTMDSGTTMDLRGIWGSSSFDVYAVGVSGTILHYDGSAWTSVKSGTTESLRGIWGSGSTDVFVIGDENTILHYNGISWSPMSSGLLAHDIIDQSQTSSDGSRQIYGDNWRAQLIEAGLNGALTRITLKASSTGSPPGDLTVDLRDATEVYETTLDQSQLLYDSNKQIYGDNWVAQIFRPELSGQLKDVFLRASKIGSPSGSLTVELRNLAEVYGATVLDQTQTSWNTEGLSPFVWGNNWVAQTFQAGSSGQLPKIALTASKNSIPPPLVVELRNWDEANNCPGAVKLAEASRSDIGPNAARYEFTFDTPPGVIAGAKYSIVAHIEGNGGASNKYYKICYTSTNPYANGRKCSSTNGGSSWTGTNNDLYFQTYINPSLGYVPGSTLATASRGDIATGIEADYDFSFSSPYSITKGKDYALVIHTSGGDASNYYTIASNSAGGYADGRESSSTDAGLNWTISSSADLYFQTYVQHLVGYNAGGNSYATASRSDITAEGDYDFAFDTPYSVVPTVKYAIVIHTSGGDASNCYNIAYNSSGGYDDGKEYYSSNAGSQWDYIDTADLYFKTYVVEPLDMFAVWGKNSDVFVVGSSGAALHYNGSTWNNMSSNTMENLRSIWGSGASDVFAIGDSGTIIHYNGSAWSSMTSGTAKHLHGIWGSSSSDVFAVGDLGTILHYNGSAWSSMTSNTGNNLKDIWGTSSSNVLAVGHSSTRYWYIKGTPQWKYMTAGDWVEVTQMPADPSGKWYLLKTWEPDGRQRLTWMPNFGSFTGNKTYIMVFEATGTLGWGFHYLTPMFISSDGQPIPLEPTAGVCSAMYNIILEAGGLTVSAVISFTADGEVKLISYEVIS